MTPPTMHFAIEPLLWAEREHGVESALCAAEHHGRQFIIVANSASTSSTFERTGADGMWSDVTAHESFVEALEFLTGLLDSIAIRLSPAEGTVVVVLPAEDGLVAVVRTASGYARAFEPWDDPGAILVEGGTVPTITKALEWDIAEMHLNG